MTSQEKLQFQGKKVKFLYAPGFAPGQLKEAVVVSQILNLSSNEVWITYLNHDDQTERRLIRYTDLEIID